ncbi:putative lipid II flippase FtsW [Microbacterium sp. ASV49]|uniref:Probable peptidoglycan glycosyltransferase FtsW n=1 Tax=Microbacterium candidum TaxID=3041922 RepID=A0ABT7N3Y3_9MICO|nr:putative lipid II flippase FtsW [Microbacterium sp. ASV49]MDL9981415.1 putative lipid II flippase FtsW [Microbacterium sp. ASV49]
MHTADPLEGEQRRGLAARISLGRVFAPVSPEFLLIASTALILTGFGLVMILSATAANSAANGQSPYDSVLKQAMFAAVGIPLMFIASRASVAFWKKIAWPLLLATTAFQLLVFTPLGDAVNGNRNWIHIGSFQAQPAEFLKLGLVLWVGAVLARKASLLASWKHVFIPVVPVAGAVIATDLAGHDLGTAIILFFIALAALYFAGVKLRMFAIPMLAAVAVVVILAATSEDRRRRIFSFLNPDCLADYYNTCYQPLHGIWGLATGGVFGVGLGNSKQKYGWLPVASNDYIFSIVGEELGLIGCCVVLALFAIFAIAVFRIVRRTDDPFVRIVSGAIVLWIVGQAFINIAVVLQLLPSFGVPLPLMSQGGTSLVSSLVACGVLLSFTRTLPRRDAVIEGAAPAAVRPRKKAVTSAR